MKARRSASQPSQSIRQKRALVRQLSEELGWVSNPTVLVGGGARLGLVIAFPCQSDIVGGAGQVTRVP